jgi:hypothetical protein
VLLAMAYAKSKKDDLTQREKRLIFKILEKQRNDFSK